MKLLWLPPDHLRGAMVLAGLLAALVLSQLWARALSDRNEKEAALSYQSPPALLVIASGQVVKPGLHALAPGSSIKDLALLAAPSFALSRIPENIKQLPLTSGQEVLFSTELPSALQIKPLSGKRRIVLSIPLDINTATASDLEALPHIGKEMAKRIVRFREINGPFLNLNDLTRVKGLGPKTLEKVQGLLVTGSPFAADMAADR